MNEFGSLNDNDKDQVSRPYLSPPQLYRSQSSDPYQTQPTNHNLSLRNRLRKWRAEHTFLSLVGEVVFLLVFVILPFRTFIAQPFMVSGESMAPTFSDDDYLIVNQLSKRVSGEFDRFDVVIFRYPKDESKFFIKRIVALPGERVMVSNDQVTIYNENNPEGLTLDNGYTQGITTGSNDITLSQDEYFVLGDNRSNSSDSRFWGPLPLKNIIGTPLIRVYPFNKADLQPGQVLP